MKYQIHEKKPRSLIGILMKILLGILVIGFVSAYAGWQYFMSSLEPVSSTSTTREVTIENGLSVGEIGTLLQKKGLIKKAWAFQRYVQLKGAARYLQAGTYSLSPSQDTPSIVAQLTHGKVATELVTILPGQRLDQIRTSLINQGFSESDVDAALEPTQYENMAALADKPKGASLEGYLFPETFQRTAKTTTKDVVEQSITMLNRQLTPEIKAGFTRQGLTTYQGIILASIVEKEVVTVSDREQAAQVFISRIKNGMSLGSDVTAFYGSELAGRGQDVTYDTPYNTRIHTGLPPTPISNVSTTSLKAVASPSNTDWLFFVAGDDGTTYFSQTNAEHQALVDRYCIKLCQ